MVSCKDISNSNDSAAKEKELIAKARSIHDKVIVLDTHCDINIKHFTDSINYTQELNSQVTLSKMDQGGVDVAWFIVYAGQDSLTDQGFSKAYEKAISKFDAIHRLVTDIAPDRIELALNSKDVRRIHNSGKKVAMIGIENGYPVGTDIKNVEKFYNLGGRYMSLAHNGHSQLSDSNTGEEDGIWLHNGLSDLGKEVVLEMNRLGMMIDVSHPSREAMKQMVALSRAPIIASHSSARALCDHSRNLDDEQLLLIKDNGGLIQTVAFDAYLNTEKYNMRREIEVKVGKKIADSMGVQWLTWDDVRKLDDAKRNEYYDFYDRMNIIRKERLKKMIDIPPAVSLSDFVDHIDYMVKLIGIDHVGISSDFDGGGGVEGWDNASETFNVTLELVRRGYTDEQIEKLWGGNLLRVLNEVEDVAKVIQSEKN
jgi:membrane dipeptidase